MSSRPEPAEAAGTSADRLRKRFVWIGIALIALIVASDVYEGWDDYQFTLVHSQQTLDLLSKSLSDQTDRVLQDLDFALADFAAANARTDASTAPQAIRRQLYQQLTRLPFVHSAAVFGPDGRLRVSTTQGATPDVTIDRAPVFAGARDAAGDALYVGSAWTSRPDGYRTFAVSRRLRDADGHFAGVIVARVAFEYLARSLGAIDISPGASIRLLRADGTTLASRAKADGDGRLLTATTSVAGYPVRLQVTQPVRAALATWRRQELASAARTLTLAALAGLLLAALSISLRRSAEADASRARSESQLQEARKVEAMSLLAAAVAHDFNNVLGAIVGYGELARDTASHESATRGYLDRLLVAAERARQLVRRVLTFDPHRSRSETDVALAPLIREIADQLRATAPQSVTIETELPATMATVRGDATEVYQVVMNLCTNAIEAMPNGGTLAIRLAEVSVTAARRLVVGNLESGTWWSLSVVDQGNGISSENLGTLFDSLYAAGKLRLTKGIGLAVVRNIVMAMQGAIDVESEVRVGSRFTVYWRTGSLVQTAEPASRISGTGSGQSILIVDDEPELVTLVGEMAASLGYEPVGYSDPVLALQAVQRDPARFDAVLTDERMPALSGTDLARGLHDLRPDVPVIVMTAYQSAEFDSAAKRSGVTLVLQKPLRTVDLARAMQHLMGSTGVATPRL